jgi:hypothetical protein
VDIHDRYFFSSLLEAQIRGSRYAWDIRLVSVDGLLRLTKLKEEVEDPLILKKIWGVLTPQEFTRVDGIIDLVFLTAEDVQQETKVVTEAAQEPKGKPAGEAVSEGEFREACMDRVRRSLGGRPIVKQSRATYASPDGSLAVVALVSREYENPAGSLAYWYGLRVHQKQWLDKAVESYVAFGCGSEQTLLLVPLTDVASWLPGLHTTERDGTTLYWHVRIERDGDSFTLSGKEGVPKRDISKYLLSAESRAAVGR